MKRLATLGLLLPALLLGCDDMLHQAKDNDYANRRTAPGEIPAGIVAFQSRPVAPPPVTMALLERGRERYRIDCVPCHSETGDGRGMVVQRGFPAPESFHLQRQRDASAGHLYDVITNGYGVMYSFASRVEPADRWAIVAYIRALQHSQDATLADLTAEQKAALP